jgi:hypothetical protein
LAKVPLLLQTQTWWREEMRHQYKVRYKKKIKKVFTPVTRAIIMAPTHQDICKAVDKLEKEVNNSLKSMS